MRLPGVTGRPLPEVLGTGIIDARRRESALLIAQYAPHLLRGVGKPV
jgi:hypothetical protein